MSDQVERRPYAPKLPPGTVWRKSPYSADNHCVLIADLPGDGGVAVRDSKDPNGPVLCFTPKEWAAFRLGIMTGVL